MNERELRRLFRRIVVCAAPMPIALGSQGCGGTVTDGTRSEDGRGTGGVPVFSGVADSGPILGSSGGVPVFAGQPAAGGVPVFTGQIIYTGAGGYTGRPPATGGGSSAGGSSAGGSSAGGFGGTQADSGAPWPPFCNETPLVCGTRCILISNGAPPAGPDQLDAGALPPSECTTLCGSASALCSSFVYAGERYLRCEMRCIGGRRPDGFADALPTSVNHLARYFESMARLEAASVPAFRILRRELGLHGAPKKLRRSALAAARDEIRHTRATRDLARRHGGRYVPPVIEPRPPRSIEAIAIENAVEGCVRETFGAMMATWQAQVSTDPAVRKAMKAIARDETRHAALALRVAKWSERRLDPLARARVTDAKRAAVATVMSELDYAVPEELATIAGVPSGAEARLMAAALEQELWS